MHIKIYSSLILFAFFSTILLAHDQQDNLQDSQKCLTPLSLEQTDQIYNEIRGLMGRNKLSFADELIPTLNKIKQLRLDNSSQETQEKANFYEAHFIISPYYPIAVNQLGLPPLLRENAFDILYRNLNNHELTAEQQARVKLTIAWISSRTIELRSKLSLQNAFEYFRQASGSPYLSPFEQAVAKFSMAIMGYRNCVNQETINNEQIFNYFRQTLPFFNGEAQLNVKYFMACMRYDKLVDNSQLTNTKTFGYFKEWGIGPENVKNPVSVLYE